MNIGIRSVLAVSLVCHGAAMADTIFDTGVPDPGFFGYVGYDIFVEQSVGVAFTPNAAYALDTVGVWFMSNDFKNPGRTFSLSLREGIEGSNNGIPGEAIIESWTVSTSAIGWIPVLETVNSSVRPVLNPGVQYWLVAESSELAGEDPLWTWGSSFEPVVSAINNPSNGGWISGITHGSAPGVIVTGTLVPAPAGFALAGLGALGATARRRR